MKPISRARCRADKAGENKAASWAKATSSAGVADPMVASAELLKPGDGDKVGRAKCHKKVSGARCPVRTRMVSLTDTVTTSAAVTAVYCRFVSLIWVQGCYHQGEWEC
jgi:hypothetical protein